MDSRKNRIRTNIAKEHSREEDETCRTHVRRGGLERQIIEGKIEEKGGRGRPQTSLVDRHNIMDWWQQSRINASSRKQNWLECSQTNHSSALRYLTKRERERERETS